MVIVHSYLVLKHIVPLLTAGHLLFGGKEPNDLAGMGACGCSLGKGSCDPCSAPAGNSHQN